MIGRILELLNLTSKVCKNCGKEFEPQEQGYLCWDCVGEIKPHHPIDYKELEFVSSYKVFSLYEGSLAECIRLIKFGSVEPLARILGDRISEDLKSFIYEVNPDLITTVPLHPLRLWNRGFDHNGEILKGAGVDFEEILVRVRYAKPLASYGKERRSKVLEGAYRVRRKYMDEIEGKRIFVFDDILTTGTTCRNIAELLLSLGADKVFFYFVAKEG